MTIKIEFSMDSLDEAAFIMTTVQRAAQQVRARMTAQANAGGADAAPVKEARQDPSEGLVSPVATATPSQPATDSAPAAPLPPQPEQASGPAVQAAPVAPAGPAETLAANLAAIPARRGRGRPRKAESTPAPDAALVNDQPATPPVPAATEPAPAVEPVTPTTGELVPPTGPVNLFAAPVAVASADSTVPTTTAPAAAKITSAEQGAKIGLKPEQRQALFAQVYSMKPDGPAKAIALVKMFGVTRVPDLGADSLAEFDELAARTLHNTFDPRNGRPE